MHPTQRVFFAFGIVLSGLRWDTAAAQNTPAVPHWQPDKPLVRQLETAVKIEGYSLQPPKHYSMQKGNAPAGVKRFAWVGAARTTGEADEVSSRLV